MIPNKTTLRAMKDAEEGIGLKSYKSIDDFFKKMGVSLAKGDLQREIL